MVFELRKVSKRFPSRAGRHPTVALGSVNIAFLPGEVVSIIGSSCCGTGRLLRMGAGLLRPRLSSQRCPHGCMPIRTCFST